MSDIKYLLECALVIARREQHVMLIYFIGLALMEAGSNPTPSANDN